MNLKETDYSSIMLHIGNLSHKHFAYQDENGEWKEANNSHFYFQIA